MEHGKHPIFFCGHKHTIENIPFFFHGHLYCSQDCYRNEARKKAEDGRAKILAEKSLHDNHYNLRLQKHDKDEAHSSVHVSRTNHF